MEFSTRNLQVAAAECAEVSWRNKPNENPDVEDVPDFGEGRSCER